MAEAKPSEFFVGVVEFFSVLLPGATLLTAGLWVAEDHHMPTLPHVLVGQASWAAFAIGAYIVGAFVFLITAVMDEHLYDPWREARWPKEIDLAFAEAKQLRDDALHGRTRTAVTPSPTGVAVPGYRRRVALFATEFLEQLRKRFLPATTDAPDDVMNVFSWAKAVLALAGPAAHADVLRYEAEAKFYRSMVLVVPLTGAALACKTGAIALSAAVAAGLTVLSFLRYAERRHKSTEWAYRYLIALTYGPKPAAPERPLD